MKFRLPELKDKEIIKLYIEEHYSHNEKSLSASNNLTSMYFEDWVNKIHNNVNIPDKEWGKSLTYLAFDDMDKLVGLLSVRYDLPIEKVKEFGHIGYGVRPSERRKGYATKMISLALEECKKLGMDKVLLVCDKDNIGSVKSIINNGGVLENEVLKEGKLIQRYWIML